METCGLALPSKFSVSHPLNCSSWSISILLDYKKWFKSYFALFYQEASLCPLMPLIPRRNSFADCHEQAGVRHSQESRAHHMEWLLRKTTPSPWASPTPPLTPTAWDIPLFSLGQRSWLCFLPDTSSALCCRALLTTKTSLCYHCYVQRSQTQHHTSY